MIASAFDPKPDDIPAIFPPIWSPLREIALSYNVDHSTISRLKTRYAVEA